MIDSKVQFAVVREDPDIETELLKRHPNPKRAFLIASGGCTALTLQARFPDLELTLLDPNPAQIDLIKQKLEILTKLDATRRAQAFGVGVESREALTGCGNFESLFSCFRHFLRQFVLDQDEWLRVFIDPVSTASLLTKAFGSKRRTISTPCPIRSALKCPLSPNFLNNGLLKWRHWPGRQ